MKDYSAKDLRQLEIIREQEMKFRGKQRYDQRLDKAVPSTQNIESSFVVQALPKVAQEIEKVIQGNSQVTRGRPKGCIPDIKKVCPKKLALIGLTSILDSVSKGNTRNSAYVMIGQRIEIENIRIALEEKETLKVVNKIETVIKKESQKFSDRRLYLQSVSKQKGLKLRPWDAKRHVKAAEIIVSVVLSHSDYFDEWNVTINNRTKSRFGMLPEATARLADLNYDASWQAAILEPMVDVPNDWDSFYTGGYHDQATASLVPLVKGCSYSQRTTIEQQLSGGKTTPYVNAVNTVQKTPLQINEYTLDAVRWAWDNEKQIDKFPSKKKFKIAQFPSNFKDLEPREQKRLKNERKKLEVKNREIDGHIASMALDMRVADELSSFTFFYLVWQLCSRGRGYAASPFNYHREDSIKSLFNLGRGKVLDDNGLYWLAVHIANVGDFEKVSKKSLDARVQWTQDNEDLILNVGTDFEGSFAIWKTADKPFQFLAACNAWARYKFNPDTYECGLPISLDGSSSGTQHFSAASLSAEDGRLVNLTQESEPQDLYGAVSDKVEKKVRKILDTYIPVINRDKNGEIIEDRTLEIAKAWMTPITIEVDGLRQTIFPGLTRSIVKRNVMTYGYSSVKYGFADQLMEDVISKIDDKVMRGYLKENPFGSTETEQKKAASFLAGINYESVQEVLTSVAAGMKFFSGVAGILAHEGKHLKFKNKIKFPMQQKYTHWAVEKVRLFLYDRVASLEENKPVHRRSQISVRTHSSAKVDKKKSKSAVSANLIHCQDSCHLWATVLHMESEYKIKDFFLIHDAFATVPNNTEFMYTAVRESFINLYEDYCLFNDVAEQANRQLSDLGRKKLEELEIPAKGNLNLAAVRNSQYCFC